MKTFQVENILGTGIVYKTQRVLELDNDKL